MLASKFQIGIVDGSVIEGLNMSEIIDYSNSFTISSTIGSGESPKFCHLLFGQFDMILKTEPDVKKKFDT